MVMMGRIIDDRGRILGRVSIVDILVVLVIAALVIFAYVRFAGGGSTTVPVRVTYTAQTVDQATAAQLEDKKGTVRDDVGTVLGQVESVTSRPTVEERVGSSGQLEALESPIFRDVDIVVRGEAVLSESTVRIGNVPLRVGRRVTLVGTGYEVQCAITRVEVLQ